MDNRDHLNEIKEGAELDLALKSKEGQAIVDAVVGRLSTNLGKILVAEGMSADAILEKVYECRGIVASLAEVGDKINLAHFTVARRVANEQIKVRS